MENWIKQYLNEANLRRWWWVLLMVFLILTCVFGAGFMAGSLRQIGIYQSRVEKIADINRYYP